MSSMILGGMIEADSNMRRFEQRMRISRMRARDQAMWQDLMEDDELPAAQTSTSKNEAGSANFGFNFITSLPKFLYKSKFNTCNLAMRTLPRSPYEIAVNLVNAVLCKSSFSPPVCPILPLENVDSHYFDFVSNFLGSMLILHKRATHPLS